MLAEVTRIYRAVGYVPPPATRAERAARHLPLAMHRHRRAERGRQLPTTSTASARLWDPLLEGVFSS